MRKDVEVITRPVRQITIRTGRSWRQFRDDYERAVPLFDRLEAVGVARSGGDWEAIRQLSDVTAVNGFVNFWVASPRWPELSASEVAVVRLVATGATNREVGDQLFLSPHTVNAHLRRIFTKLGIRSRVELARLTAQRDTK